jgi:hypothetical protein
MTAERLSFVMPVPDLDLAVGFWRDALGVAPTFVDGDCWAQFDYKGVRLALAGADRAADAPGAMIKVSDLETAVAQVAEGGYEVSEIVVGAHERRAVVTGPGDWPVILYAPAG